MRHPSNLHEQSNLIYAHIRAVWANQRQWHPISLLFTDIYVTWNPYRHDFKYSNLAFVRFQNLRHI